MPTPPASLVITAARKVPNARKDALARIVRMDDDAIYKFRSPQSVDLGKIRLAETNHLRLRLDTAAWKTKTNAPAPSAAHDAVPEEGDEEGEEQSEEDASMVDADDDDMDEVDE